MNVTAILDFQLKWQHTGWTTESLTAQCFTMIVAPTHPGFTALSDTFVSTSDIYLPAHLQFLQCYIDSFKQLSASLSWKKETLIYS